MENQQIKRKVFIRLRYSDTAFSITIKPLVILSPTAEGIQSSDFTPAIRSQR